jgi:tRNA(Ile)-lysidine synthase
LNDVLIKKVAQYIHKNGLLPQCQAKIVVGVSGGVDSSVLLYILHHLGYKCQAAHCNFHLRGDESSRDEKHAALLASSMNLVFFKKDFNTQYLAQRNKISIEMAARVLRYKWFEYLRQEQNAEVIAVAHHKGDNIETLLLNLVRGTGIRGLKGIRPKHGKIIRPLLDITRQEIVQFAKDNRIVYVDDSSNFEEKYIRNKIRFKLLPLLKTLNPSVEQVLLHTIENLAEVIKIYDSHIEEARNKVFNPDIGMINIIELQKFPSPESILFEILKTYGFGRDVIYNITRAMKSLSSKEFYSLQYILIKDRERFLLIPREESSKNKIYEINKDDREMIVPLPIRMRYKDIGGDNFQIKCNPNIAFLDVKKLQFPLQLRKWERGDRFVPFGMRNFQKLSDYFNNHKFSKLEKKNTWLLCSRDDIVWIVGKRIDNRYRVSSTTRRVIIFESLEQ